MNRHVASALTLLSLLALGGLSLAAQAAPSDLNRVAELKVLDLDAQQISGKVVQAKVTLSDDSVSLDLVTDNCPKGARCLIGPMNHVHQFTIESVTKDSCGSVTTKGREIEQNPNNPILRGSIEVVDHSKRICRDYHPYETEVTYANDRGESHFGGAALRVLEPEVAPAPMSAAFSSSSILDRISNAGRVTCMAYWTGVEFNAQTGVCERRGASGCGNPFEFLTIEDCEASHPANAR